MRMDRHGNVSIQLERLIYIRLVSQDYKDISPKCDNVFSSWKAGGLAFTDEQLQ